MRRRHRGAHYGRWILLAVFVVLLIGAAAAGAAVTWVVRTANSAPALSSYVPKNPGSLSEVFPCDSETPPRLHPVRRPRPARRGQPVPEGPQRGDGRHRGR